MLMGFGQLVSDIVEYNKKLNRIVGWIRINKVIRFYLDILNI